MCTVKKKTTIFLLVYCILRLSFYSCAELSPLDSWSFSKICNMLDRPSLSGFLCFIIYNLVGLWVYVWRRNEPPWCPVLFVRQVGWTATQSAWRWSEPSHCHNPDSVETFFIHSTFSVFNNKFSQLFLFFFLKYLRTSASLLSSAVIWCFLYIRHEFDTAIVAVFIKIFNKTFSISFCKSTKKELQHDFFFCYFLLLSFFFFFFFNTMSWHF